jgi:hypothetical protein
LMNCIAFSSDTSGEGVIKAWKWSGMMTNACKKEPSLAAIVEDGLL